MLPTAYKRTFYIKPCCQSQNCRIHKGFKALQPMTAYLPYDCRCNKYHGYASCCLVKHRNDQHTNHIADLLLRNRNICIQSNKHQHKGGMPLETIVIVLHAKEQKGCRKEHDSRQGCRRCPAAQNPVKEICREQIYSGDYNCSGKWYPHELREEGGDKRRHSPGLDKSSPDICPIIKQQVVAFNIVETEFLRRMNPDSYQHADSRKNDYM